jgi:hypothetical protein
LWLQRGKKDVAAGKDKKPVLLVSCAVMLWENAYNILTWSGMREKSCGYS